MIDNLFGNKALIRVIRFLYSSPNRYFSFLELEKYIGSGRESLVLALKKLEYSEMIYTEQKNGKKYKLKLDHPLIERIKPLFDYEKSFFQGIDPLKLNVLSNFENDCLKQLKGIDSIWLFGSVAKGKSKETSDIDLLVLTKNGKNTPLFKTKLEKIKEKYEERYKIQTILMDEDEFKARKKETLVQEIIKSGINLILKN